MKSWCFPFSSRTSICIFITPFFIIIELSCFHSWLRHRGWGKIFQFGILLMKFYLQVRDRGLQAGFHVATVRFRCGARSEPPSPPEKPRGVADEDATVRFDQCRVSSQGASGGVFHAFKTRSEINTIYRVRSHIQDLTFWCSWPG